MVIGSTVNVTVNVLSQEPPKLAITSIYPENMNFTAGQEVNFTFVVENAGGTVGEAFIKLSMPDFELTNRTWVEPFETENLTFNLIIPDDLEEKTYKGVYELNGEEHEFTYSIEGIKISVSASLDKNLYDEGENAILTLNVENERNNNLRLYSRIGFNDYENITYFNLSGYGNKTLVFTIPVTFADNKILYAVYMDSGRSIYINSIYVHEKPDAPITLYTDRDVYGMGDNVITYINTTEEGLLNLTAPDYSYNNTVNGSLTLEFTLPELVQGTYYINYTFNNFSALYPFDVAGYFARVIEAELDSYEYTSGDEINLSIVMEANRDISGLIDIWIYDSDLRLIDWNETSADLAEGENELRMGRTFITNVTGLHAIVYGFYANLTEGTGLLVYGMEFFDGYSNDTFAPVISNVAVTNLSQASATIKWDTDELSDSLVKYGIVSGNYTQVYYNSSITTSHSIDIGSLSPGTTYYFVVNSTDREGNSNESVENQFVTESITTPAPSDERVGGGGRGGGGGGGAFPLPTTTPTKTPGVTIPVPPPLTPTPTASPSVIPTRPVPLPEPIEIIVLREVKSENDTKEISNRTAYVKFEYETTIQKIIAVFDYGNETGYRVIHRINILESNVSDSTLLTLLNISKDVAYSVGTIILPEDAIVMQKEQIIRLEVPAERGEKRELRVVVITEVEENEFIKGIEITHILLSSPELGTAFPTTQLILVVAGVSSVIVVYFVIRRREK